MIRPATMKDLPDILELCPEYARVSGFEDLAGYEPVALHKTLQALIEGLGVLLVIDTDTGIVGVAGAFVVPWYFSSQKMAQQIILWIKPEYRLGSLGLHLVRDLERNCIAAGAKSIIMTSLDSLHGDELGKLYRRCGYAPLERHYIKQVEA